MKSEALKHFCKEHHESKGMVKQWCCVQDVERMKKKRAPIMEHCYNAFFDAVISDGAIPEGDESEEELSIAAFIIYVHLPFFRVNNLIIRLDSLKIVVFSTNAGVLIFILVLLFFPNLGVLSYQSTGGFRIV